MRLIGVLAGDALRRISSLAAERRCGCRAAVTRSARSLPPNAMTFLACALAAFAAVGFGALPAQAAPQDLTFTTTADAYVDDGAPTVAHGTQASTDCFVNDDVSSRRECRLRFVVVGMRPGDTVASSRVLIRNKGGAGAKLVNMSTVAASPIWTENAITWSNRRRP